MRPDDDLMVKAGRPAGPTGDRRDAIMVAVAVVALVACGVVVAWQATELAPSQPVLAACMLVAVLAAVIICDHVEGALGWWQDRRES